MQLKKVFFMMIIVIINSCVGNHSDMRVIDMERIDGVSQQQEFSTTDVFEKITFVPLETTDAGLLRDVSDLRETAQYLFITSDNGLYQFDVHGKFIRKIGQIGQGPGDYAGITAFDIDESQQTLFIHDYMQQKIIKYSFDGAFIESYRIPVFVDGMTYMRLAKQGELLYLNNTNSFRPDVFILNDSKKELVTIAEKERPIVAGEGQRDGNKVTYVFRNSIYFKHAFNDTVFKYDESKISPAYLLKASQYYYSFADLDFNNSRVTSGRKITMRSIIEFDSGLFVFYEITNYDIATRADRTKYYLLYHNHHAGVTTINAVFKHNETDLASFDGQSLFFAGKGNNIYSVIDALEIVTHPNPPVSVNEDDNPVLIRYTLK